MLNFCPKKVMNSAMDTTEAQKWCERNRSAKQCFDCPLFPQRGKFTTNLKPAGKGKTKEQKRLF
jgi:hypothetical protein